MLTAKLHQGTADGLDIKASVRRYHSRNERDEEPANSHESREPFGRIWEIRLVVPREVPLDRRSPQAWVNQICQ